MVEALGATFIDAPALALFIFSRELLEELDMMPGDDGQFDDEMIFYARQA